MQNVRFIISILMIIICVQCTQGINTNSYSFEKSKSNNKNQSRALGFSFMLNKSLSFFSSQTFLKYIGRAGPIVQPPIKEPIHDATIFLLMRTREK